MLKLRLFYTIVVTLLATGTYTNSIAQPSTPEEIARRELYYAMSYNRVGLPDMGYHWPQEGEEAMYTYLMEENQNTGTTTEALRNLAKHHCRQRQRKSDRKHRQ